jgi:hypothetical protein
MYESIFTIMKPRCVSETIFMVETRIYQCTQCLNLDRCRNYPQGMLVPTLHAVHGRRQVNYMSFHNDLHDVGQRLSWAVDPPSWVQSRIISIANQATTYRNQCWTNQENCRHRANIEKLVQSHIMDQQSFVTSRGNVLWLIGLAAPII